MANPPRTPSPAGVRVRFLRETAGLTTRELDDLASLTHGHTSQIENTLGGRVSARTVVDIARVFGVTANWLLDGDGDSPTPKSIARAVKGASASRVRSA